MALDVPQFTDSTALGSALAASMTLGHIDMTFVRDLPREGKVYEPTMSADERAELLHNWHRAVERAKGWNRK